MINANQYILLLHGRPVALLEHIMMINANQSMLLLHG